MNLRILALSGLAVFAGGMIPIQTALNATLARRMGSTVLTATASFLVATLFLAVIVLLTRPQLPVSGDFAGVSPFIGLGGVIGGLYVMCLVFLAPRIGVGLTTALVILGQVATGAALDHFGTLGLREHPFGLARALALLLMGAGVLIFQRS